MLTLEHIKRPPCINRPPPALFTQIFAAAVLATSQWVGRYYMSNVSECVSSTHLPVQLHCNVPQTWVLGTYSMVLETFLYAS